MFDISLRYSLSIDEINSSESFNDNWELFSKGVKILERKLNKKDFSEFTDNEREILESIYEIINNE